MVNLLFRAANGMGTLFRFDLLLSFVCYFFLKDVILIIKDLK